MAMASIVFDSTIAAPIPCNSVVRDAFRCDGPNIDRTPILPRPVSAAVTVTGVAAAFGVATMQRRRCRQSRKAGRQRVACKCSSAALTESQRDLLEAHFRVSSVEPVNVSQADASVADDVKTMTSAELEQELRTAVAQDCFERAAKVRDEIQERSLEAEVAVLAKNNEFIKACLARDLERMSELWHKGDHTCCIHAESKPVYGFEAIMDSWAGVFQKSEGNPDYGEHSVVIRENVARAVYCRTFKTGAGAVITNHFERAPDGWKLSCHQATTISASRQRSRLAIILSSVPDWIRRQRRRRREAALRKASEEEGRRQRLSAELRRQMEKVASQ
mmetsp:Transcript_122531/g.357815  ORF Transcript_122531/g.357815 Transcript_122531/m.357815 type:complete len:332 (+) Transcript_122531:35-1030(+)